MAITVTNFRAAAGIDFAQQNSLTYATPSWLVSWAPSVLLSAGTGSGQIDLAYAWDGTIAGGASLTVDLNGSLSGPLGDSILMARVKVIFFQLKVDTQPSGVLVGAAAANSIVTWQVPVKNTATYPGIFELVLPDAVAIPVTAATADQFRIVNQDGSVVATYRMFIAGSSA